MSFLILLLAVILFHGMPQVRGLHADQWLPGWHDACRKVTGGNATFCLVLFLVLPVAVVAGVVCLLGWQQQGLMLFAFELLVLLYSFGRGDLLQQLSLLRNDFKREDIQAAYHDAAELNISHRVGSSENWPDFYQELLAALPYRFFERTFAVIFWFLLLGAPGAIAYRLLALHGDLALNGEQSLRARLLWLMEWAPARLLALTLGLVGNFSYAVGHLQEMIFCPRTATAELLRKVLTGALAVDQGNESPALVGVEQIPQIEALFRRSLVAWLVVLALTVVLS